MAYVIAVCGSGGKTTLVKNLAKQYANADKKVCITTTTHMWCDEDVKESLIIGTNTCKDHRRGELCEPEYVSLDRFLGASKVESGKVYYIANLNRDKELITPLNDDDYKLVCEKFDYVIIEADGSRSMPLKIPKSGEPVIPKNTNEIIVVVGTEAIGREIGVVCHRFYEFYGKDKYIEEKNLKPETIVTEELVDDFVGHYYVKPLKEKYNNAKVVVYKNCFNKSNINNFRACENSRGIINKVTFVLLAAGFSKRFGENKLLVKVNDKSDTTTKPMYEVMIEKLLNAKSILLRKFDKTELANQEVNESKNINEIEEKNVATNELMNKINVQVIVVSQYDEILNDEKYKNKVVMIKNDNASKGMSESIKRAVYYLLDEEKDLHCITPVSAALFVNADMPHLPEWELANFVYNSIRNNNGIAAMCSNNEPKSPAYFEREYFGELMELSGDKGARALFEKYKMHLYKYYISDRYLIDIDKKEDIKC